jgi:hypothetical protein
MTVRRQDGWPIDSWNYSPTAPFLGALAALALSQQNLGLEFTMLVLYYSSARCGVLPNGAIPLYLLLVSSDESL